MCPHIFQLFCHFHIIFKRIFIPFWIENIAGVTDRGLTDSTTFIDRIHGNLHPIGPIQGIVIFDGSTTNATVENNVVITDHWHGITIFGAYNCKIINNTVLAVPNTAGSIGPPSIWIDKKKDGTSSSGNTIRNNLTTGLIVEEGSSTADHNVVSTSADLFVNDYNNWDFMPKEGFKLNGLAIIDAGSPDDAPLTDIDGNVRPQGNGFDIGAYESAFSLEPPPDDLLTTYEQDFNGDVDTSFWANNWAAGRITGEERQEQ